MSYIVQKFIYYSNDKQTNCYRNNYSIYLLKLLSNTNIFELHNFQRIGFNQFLNPSI